jgi:CRISPR-associated exonuclease Cas4
MHSQRDQKKGNQRSEERGIILEENSSTVFSATDIEFDTETTPMITPSEIIEHLFCPRYTYFMNCLNIPQHEELRYKVLKGRELHENKEKVNIDYVRKRLGCVEKEISVYLASKELGIRGKIDEVLHLSDGTLAPLDYKYAEHGDFIFRTHRVQSAVYALLIMENYGKAVKKGFICYVRGGSLIKEIIYSQNDFNFVRQVITEIFDIIIRGYYPKKTAWEKRCIDCCYHNICV